MTGPTPRQWFAMLSCAIVPLPWIVAGNGGIHVQILSTDLVARDGAPSPAPEVGGGDLWEVAIRNAGRRTVVVKLVAMAPGARALAPPEETITAGAESRLRVPLAESPRGKGRTWGMFRVSGGWGARWWTVAVPVRETSRAGLVVHPSAVHLATHADGLHLDYVYRAPGGASRDAPLPQALLKVSSSGMAIRAAVRRTRPEGHGVEVGVLEVDAKAIPADGREHVIVVHPPAGCTGEAEVRVRRGRP